MALFVNYHGQSLFQLGSYTFTQLGVGAPSDAQLGIVCLIGEADSGPSWAQETTGLGAVTFSPSQFSTIQAKYGSGELVDAAALALSPSNDPDILGGAQQLILMKTNQGAKASLALASSYGTIKAKNYGTPGNLTNVTITQATNTLPFATVTGTTSSSSTAVTSVSSTVGLSVGLKVAGTGIAASTTIAAVTASGITLSQNATASGTVTLTITEAATQDTITLSRSDLGLTEISSALGGTQVLAIKCTDGSTSAATLTLTATTLSTTITGGTAASLSLATAQFGTVAQLAEYINAQSGYSAVILATSQSQSPVSSLDLASAVDIKTAYYPLNRDAADVQAFFATSSLVDFTPSTGGVTGVPAALAKAYLSAGALGPTSQANFQTCLDAVAGANLNFIVPLFSRNATADITAGLTDASSTYSIASIHAAIRSHVNQQSTIQGRKERQAWVGYMDDSFTNVQNAAATLAAARVGLVFQQVNINKADGSSELARPHMVATIAAGMKAAAPVGLDNAFKLINASGFSTVNSTGAAYFNPITDGTTAIQSNLCYIEAAPGGGFRFAIDNSTYGQATNAWFYSRPSVIYASDVCAKTIRINTESFVGKRNSDVTGTTISNFVVSVLDRLRAQGILVADKSSKGKGWNNLNVSINGNTVSISVALVLVESLQWILSDLSIQRAQF